MMLTVQLEKIGSELGDSLLTILSEQIGKVASVARGPRLSH